MCVNCTHRPYSVYSGMSNPPYPPEQFRALLNGDLIWLEDAPYEIEELEKSMNKATTIDFMGLPCLVMEYFMSVNTGAVCVELRATKEGIDNFRYET